MIDSNKIKINAGQELIDFLESNSINKHPFFNNDKKNNIGYISLILENGRELDITGFLSRLISLTNNIEIRAKLVPQLYDELGGGNPNKIHVKLIVKLLSVVKSYAIINEQDRHLLDKAYDNLNVIYKSLFNTLDVAEGIGVAIANEIIVQPIFEYFKEIVQPHLSLFDKNDLEWILAHDELEEDHVRDSIDLANLLTNNELTKASQGAVKLHNAIWLFFDELNKINIK